MSSLDGEGWIPARHLSSSSGSATVLRLCDTSELSTEVLEVTEVDSQSGWLWCRSTTAAEGWVPSNTLKGLEQSEGIHDSKDCFLSCTSPRCGHGGDSRSSNRAMDAEIHDTAPLQATSSGLDSEPEGYAVELAITAPIGDVFRAITTDEGLSSWWASRATGSGPAGAGVVLGFSGLEETITFRIDSETYPTQVAWTCIQHTGLPDWNGTSVIFDMAQRDRAIDGTLISAPWIGVRA